MSGPPIRVLIADDEAVLRAALADLVHSDDSFELVGSARDADEAIALAEAMQPDVALVDVRMPAGGGLASRRSSANWCRRRACSPTARWMTGPRSCGCSRAAPSATS